MSMEAFIFAVCKWRIDAVSFGMGMDVDGAFLFAACKAENIACIHVAQRKGETKG